MKKNKKTSQLQGPFMTGFGKPQREGYVLSGPAPPKPKPKPKPKKREEPLW